MRRLIKYIALGLVMSQILDNEMQRKKKKKKKKSGCCKLPYTLGLAVNAEFLLQLWVT